MRTHGRVSTYKGGCRCDECRTAASEYNRRYRGQRRRHHSGFPGLQDPMRWAERGACFEMGTTLFFGKNYTDAKKVCEGCEVRTTCLAYALRTHQPDGVWGGMTRPERDRYQERRTA